MERGVFTVGSEWSDCEVREDCEGKKLKCMCMDEGWEKEGTCEGRNRERDDWMRAENDNSD